MTISYPLYMPSTPGLAAVSLQAVSNIGIARSQFTFVSQIQKNQGQMWHAEVSLPSMPRDLVEPWNAFLLALNGQQGTFFLGDPLGKFPLGIASGTPRVNGASQVGNKIITDGWSASITGILKAGDYIQLGQRLYKLTTDATSDGSGNATLDIWPDLRESPADNDLVSTIDCKGIFRLAENSNSIFAADLTHMYQFSFRAVEAI